MKKLLYMLISLTFMMGLMIGCDSTENNYTAIEGVTTQVDKTTISISTTADGQTDYVITIDENTTFGDDVSEQFVVGNKVIIEVGEVAESFPMQTTAKKILYNEEQ